MEELKIDLAKLDEFRKERKSLIPLLQFIQDELGYVPIDLMPKIAEYLNIPEVSVFGVATFFNQFSIIPKGKYHIKVCTGTACHLAGSGLILDFLKRELNIEEGNTTDDGNFSMERVACIGCCVLAPVAVINKDIHSKITTQKAEEILVNLKDSLC